MSEEAACREVVELHRFFERWLAGRSDADPMQRLEGALAECFELVGPDGRSVRRQALVEGLRDGFASRGADFRIRVEDVRARTLAEDLYHVTYVERQERAGRETARTASALLRRRAEPPGGFSWLHVQETWLSEEQ